MYESQHSIGFHRQYPEVSAWPTMALNLGSSSSSFHGISPPLILSGWSLFPFGTILFLPGPHGDRADPAEDGTYDVEGSRIVGVGGVGILFFTATKLLKRRLYSPHPPRSRVVTSEIRPPAPVVTVFCDPTPVYYGPPGALNLYRVRSPFFYCLPSQIQIASELR